MSGSGSFGQKTQDINLKISFAPFYFQKHGNALGCPLALLSLDLFDYFWNEEGKYKQADGNSDFEGKELGPVT